jgi:hypothetical protein
MQRTLIAFLFLLSITFILFNCHSNEDKNLFRNIHHEEASYVGMQECKTCHAEVYNTFIKTGMGQSWDRATRQKSAADFSPAKALVYDSSKNLYYKPYWDGDSLCILEYRITDGDTVHKRIEKVSYIVGSGQHTNSHIININGYLHQAPITFYTQKGKWDLAPGFEKGLSTRFDRKIELECISCHNGYPVFEQGSLNKYSQVKTGIDCERCHGPGSIHVAEKKLGKVVDTSQGPDYSIVNPRRLSIDQQNSLCQRCHLQGVAVLNDDKSFFDFLPSDKLHQTMNVFMPNYGNDEKHMIMASHVERLQMSRCFLQSNNISCITCHNPHVSVKVTPVAQYNNACKNCHQQGKDCKEKTSIRQTQNDDCQHCHMPKNSSIDIPHVAVTDHFIRAKPRIENKNELVRFLGMKCYNNDKPDARSMARAYLEFYERYEMQTPFLDSATFYLQQLKESASHDADWIRVLFLQSNYAEIVTRCKQLKANDIRDAWQAYRIGTAFVKQQQFAQGIAFLEQSVKLKPYGLDFQYKLATAYLDAHQFEKALRTLNFIIGENPRYASAYNQRGYVYLQQQQLPKAMNDFQLSLQLDPDQVQALINLSVAYYQSNQRNLIPAILQRALVIDPRNTQVNAMMNDLQTNH